ncbi:MAG: cobalamin-independent methionine synthase II family protein [Chloroflexota bacterium]|nr:cobalamin-independent methionine synthase II family protein [Chloroflexota bacterium]MDE2969405.1 cobalamin-independent methionine synthase II family protein [Chloroflexota bacterium]
MPTPYRADHVGSLLRPPELLDARAAFAQGAMSLEWLRELEDACVLRALAMQRDAGVDILSDGEYRRPAWSAAVRESIDGLVPNPDPPINTILGQWRGPHGEVARSSTIPGTGLVVGAPVRQTRRLVEADAAFLREHAPGPWKITMPGAMSAAGTLFKPGVTDQFYATRWDLAAEVVAMLQREIAALAAEGVSYIQLDSLHYVERITDAEMRARMVADGDDPEEYLDRLIACDNAVLDAARATGVTVGLHMCRGNNRSAWHAEGSYEAMAEKAFNGLRVDRFLLEYDTDRAGGFDPLRFMPKGVNVVLGIISSKEPELEPVDALKARIEEASRYVDVDRLAISPQCGFASTQWGNLLSWDDQRRKLELVAETARAVWG